MSVNREHMRLWIEALKNWPNEQGKGYLSRIGHDGKQKDCCLGVACQVAMANGLGLSREVRHPAAPDREDQWIRYAGSEAELPPEVTEWLGIDAHDPICGTRRSEWDEELEMTISCTTANDDEDWTFAEIARHLEKTYLS